VQLATLQALARYWTTEHDTHLQLIATRRTGNATAADTGHDGVGAGRPATVSDWRKAAPNRSAATAPVIKERRLP
jgi:hypothetical protein